MNSAEGLEKRIEKMPTLPYYFDGSDGLWHCVYLGGDSCDESERINLNYVHKSAFLRLRDLYADGSPSEAALDEIASITKKLSSNCKSRLSGVFTVQEQERYLRSLTKSELGQIIGLIKMYEFCLEALKSQSVHKKREKSGKNSGR